MGSAETNQTIHLLGEGDRSVVTPTGSDALQHSVWDGASGSDDCTRMNMLRLLPLAALLPVAR